MSTNAKRAQIDPRTKAVREANIQIRQENLRQYLKGTQYIVKLHQIAEKNYSKEEIPEAKLKADIYFGLLRKCLPDLSAATVDVHLQAITVEERAQARALGIPVSEYLKTQGRPALEADFELIKEKLGDAEPTSDT